MPQPAPLTRNDALNTWQNFLPKVPVYGRSRNQVQPGHENVSLLGPSISFRTLLQDEIIADTLKRHGFEASEKWLQEVCWRLYWKGWMETHPRVWSGLRSEVKRMRKDLPQIVLERAASVASGHSGVACMDKIAHELIKTGYLHNHARMWWASFWVHSEKLPWELGADFFFQHLIDADPASNSLSWRWVAGLQTPGKSYIVRLSNIQKYAPEYLEGCGTGNERLADGGVTAKGVDETTKAPSQPLSEYPSSFTQSNDRLGLLLHPDDLCPEIGPLGAITPRSIATFSAETIYSDEYKLSQKRFDSIHAVMGDALARASAHYSVTAETMAPGDPGEAILEWVRKHRLSEVVAFAPTVGPTHELLDELKHHLELIKVRLTLIRRSTDATAFTFATEGFFPFWKKMSQHLKTR